MSRLVIFAWLGLLLSLDVPPSHAADKRVWVTLTNCQYVASKDNDGDSFRVKCGTNEFIARLYFVDALETDLRYPERTREQSEHFGVTLDETMKAGRTARERTQEFLHEPFVVYTRWAMAGGRGKEPRHCVLVEAGGKSLAEALVSQGLARTKGVAVNLPAGEKSKTYVAKLKALEQAARQQKLGVWANSMPQETEPATK